jgi:hypothetical protein
MNRCSRVKLLVLISAVGLSLPLSIASGGASHAKMKGRRTTGQTRAGATRSIVVGSGEVRRSGFIEIKGEVAGRIHQIHVQPGDEIAKGQPLLVIEPQSNAQKNVTLYSPLKGIVADVSTRVGEAAQPDSTLMILADMSRIFVEVNIGGSDISRVAVGQRARIRIDAFGEAQIIGRVVSKDPKPVALSDAPADAPADEPEFRVTIEITQVSNYIRRRIRPGMSATASIQVASKSLCKRQPIEDLVNAFAESFVNKTMGTLDADRPYAGRFTIRIEHSLADDNDPQRFEVRRFSSFARAEQWFKSGEIEDLPGRYTRPVEKCARGVCTYNLDGGINHRSLYLTKITYGIRNGCPYIKTIYILDGD